MAYETSLPASVPPTYRGKWGDRFYRIIGRVIDQGIASVQAAVRARFLSEAPADALPYIAEDLDMPRYHTDSPGALRLRLEDPWSFWETCGADDGLRTALVTLGFNADPAKTRFWEGTTGFFFGDDVPETTFYVLADETAFPERTNTWDDVARTTWDSVKTILWDIAVERDILFQAREFLWKYKSAITAPIAIFHRYGEGRLWDEALFDGATWDSRAAIVWDDAAGDARVYIWPMAQLWGWDYGLQGFVSTVALQTWDTAVELGARWAGKTSV